MKDFTLDDIVIIHEDNHILVVLKPQNLATCPDESADISLYDLLKQYLKEKYNKPGQAYLGIVHRLDRPTGGVMVFAKTSKAAERLSKQMVGMQFEKKYMAVTIGVPKERQGTMEHYLLKNSVNNTVYAVPMATEGAKRAEMDYRLLADNGKYALMELKLHTGRSHQIRVQLSTTGTPIFGDQKYAQGKTPVGYNLALWATEIKFTHPVTNQRLVFRVFPPATDVPWKVFDINRFLAVNIKNN